MKKHVVSDGATTVKKAGFRVTRPRLLLLSLLEKTASPLLVSEIISALKTKRVDPVTVYRMIEALAKAGIVREVNLAGDRPRYEISDLEHDHHHIVCTNCRTVEDFIGCDIEQLEKKALKQSHFSKITGHSFDLYGLCDACAR